MNIRAVLALVTTLAVISGCSGSREFLGASRGGGENVFQRTAPGAPHLAGYADVDITCSLKTHLAGYYLFADDRCGTPDYKPVVRIDGQAMRLEGEMKKERRVSTGDGDPEAGIGVRYTFRERIRLTPGSHHITVASPDDTVVAAREVYLKDGENYLNLQPVYWPRQKSRRMGFAAETSFYEGLRRMRMVLNGCVL